MDAERYKIGIITALIQLFPGGLPANAETLELRFGARCAFLLIDPADIHLGISRAISNPLQGDDLAISPGSRSEERKKDARFLRECGIAADRVTPDNTSHVSNQRNEKSVNNDE